MKIFAIIIAVIVVISSVIAVFNYGYFIIKGKFINFPKIVNNLLNKFNVKLWE